MNELPILFIERLKSIIPPEEFSSVLESFSVKKALTFRVNTLKATIEEVLSVLKVQEIIYREVSWYPHAFIVEHISMDAFYATGLMESGKVYIQNLSSMLPALILDPQPQEYVLDLCAAPGSKATQMADLMKNTGDLIAVEHIKPRFYKLKSIVSLLGVTNVQCVFSDGRRFRNPKQELFDKILVDAPCSSEGRFSILDKDSYSYWSVRKIKEMQKKQRGLLLSASRLLKPGGTLVYATCTFAPEENESVVDWLLRKTEGALEVVACSVKGVKSYPAVEYWNEKKFSPAVRHCWRVLPNNQMDGFFIACFKKF